MVGVRGRSRACDNCRRRRIKCDLASPACSRCVKARLLCGGSQDVCFIQYNGGKSQAAPSITAAQPSSMLQETRAAESEMISPAADLRAYSAQASFLDVSRQMPILYDEVFLTYTRSHLIRDHGDIWFDSRPLNSLTEKCLLALSTTYFGVDHVEQPITRLGLSRYGKVLSDLNRGLSDPTACQSTDLLFAVVVMALFEFLIGDKDSGWVQHSRGLEELLRLKGPESMKSLGSLIILESSRSSMIFAAIFSGRRTILSRAEWKAIPWTEHPERGDAMKLLIDILADCPELFILRNETTAQLHGTDRYSTSLQLFKSKAFKVLEDLKLWRDSNPNLLDQWIDAPTPADSPFCVRSDGQRSLFWNTILNYKSVHLANLTSLYYSIFILVSQLIQGLANGDEYQGLEEEVYSAGIIVCRSIDYHLDSVRVGADSLFIFFPMRMAFDAVGKSHAEVGTWLRNKLESIRSQSSGRWATAKYLLDLRSSTISVGTSIDEVS